MKESELCFLNAPPAFIDLGIWVLGHTPLSSAESQQVCDSKLCPPRACFSSPQGASILLAMFHPLDLPLRMLTCLFSLCSGLLRPPHTHTQGPTSTRCSPHTFYVRDRSFREVLSWNEDRSLEPWSSIGLFSLEEMRTHTHTQRDDPMRTQGETASTRPGGRNHLCPHLPPWPAGESGSLLCKPPVCGSLSGRQAQ